MRQKFYDKLRMRSIYHRVKTLTVIIGTIAILLMAIVSIIIYICSSMSAMQERESRYLSAYTANISSTLAGIDSDLSSLSASEMFQQTLSEKQFLKRSDRDWKQVQLTQAAQQIFLPYDAVSDICLYTLYAAPINVFQGPHDDFRLASLNTISLFYDTPFFSENGSYIVNAAAFSTNENYNQNGLLCLHRIIESGTTKTLGYAVLYLDKESVFGDLKQAVKTGDSRVERFVLDSEKNVVYDSGDTIKTATIEQIRSKCVDDSGSFVVTTNGSVQNALCIYSKIRGMNWYVITIVAYSTLASEIAQIIGFVLLITILLFLVYSRLSRSIATSVSVPVNDVLKSLHEIQAEDFSVHPKDFHRDELAEVNNLLNDTKLRLTQLIDQIRQTEMQKYHLRFQALQAQINPHFLVNTLNSIVWLSTLQGADNIKQLTSSLTDVLITCMHNKSTVGPIGEEILLLRNYVTIAQFRYLDQFTVEFDVDSAAEAFYAPKFFLQPLLENCLIHGLTPEISLLSISVSVQLLGTDMIRICISDDGIGMSEKRLQEISTQKPDTQMKKVHTLTSIGVTNIRERMDILYKDKPHELTIHSVDRQGTTVTIITPRLAKEDMDETDFTG